MGPVIRKATPRDAAAILAVHKAAVENLCRGHYTPAQIAAWAVPAGLPPFKETLRSTLVLVWEADGRVAGFAQLDLASREVLSLFVTPAEAGRGGGTRLLLALEDAARAAGLGRLQLHSSLNAVGFYEARGYGRRAAECQVLPDGQTRIQCILMDKELR